MSISHIVSNILLNKQYSIGVWCLNYKKIFKVLVLSMNVVVSKQTCNLMKLLREGRCFDSFEVLENWLHLKESKHHSSHKSFFKHQINIFCLPLQPCHRRPCCSFLNHRIHRIAQARGCTTSLKGQLISE